MALVRDTFHRIVEARLASHGELSLVHAQASLHDALVMSPEGKQKLLHDNDEDDADEDDEDYAHDDYEDGKGWMSSPYDPEP